MRRIPPALPLPSGVEHGPGAEAAAHTAAATWCLPDFVFQSAYAGKGSGRRELGDRLLLVGGRGAVVQVKARTVQPKEPAGEVAWSQKAATKAMRRAKGTVRQLRMLPADMVNGRDRTLSVDGNAFEWIGVFLLDHGQVPDGTICSLEPIGIPAIALTRRDWDFLFDQLRSTTAVLDYLFRGAAEPPIALGEEPVRYYEFAAADEEAPPADVDTELVGPSGRLFSTPLLLPQTPVGATGTRAHPVLRLVMEDITTSPLPDHVGEADRLAILSGSGPTPRCDLRQRRAAPPSRGRRTHQPTRWTCHRRSDADAGPQRRAPVGHHDDPRPRVQHVDGRRSRGVRQDVERQCRDSLIPAPGEGQAAGTAAVSICPIAATTDGSTR
ncbi:hypothetical protein ACIPC1_37125 [Streptomyces sp. NPDC087263]|uniref:hypothetical protein n=1 Tax=Streptomyces sp. NPDC087263 TaxID=3365773 RepID=UPI00382A2C7C